MPSPAGTGSLCVGPSSWKLELARRSLDPVLHSRGSSGALPPSTDLHARCTPLALLCLVSVLCQGHEDVPHLAHLPEWRKGAPPPRSPPPLPSAAGICPTHFPGSPLPYGQRHANEPLPQPDLTHTMSCRKSSWVQSEDGPCSDMPFSLLAYTLCAF